MLDFDQSANEALNGMNKATGVELPFPAPVIWTLNGQPAAKAAGGAAYFGGWAADAQNLEKVLQETKRQAPFGFARTSQASRDGGEYETFAARHIHVAVFTKRESWLLDGRRIPEYAGGARRHSQFLAILADLDEQASAFRPWGPVVLSAKGFQGKKLTDAIKQWEQVSGPLRRANNNVSAYPFWLTLGTFGDKREVEMVGKQGAQSPITPIKLHLPAELNQAALEKRFVGKAIMAQMADLFSQAETWLSAWNEASVEESYNGARPAAGQAQAIGSLDI